MAFNCQLPLNLEQVRRHNAIRDNLSFIYFHIVIYNLAEKGPCSCQILLLPVMAIKEKKKKKAGK